MFLFLAEDVYILSALSLLFKLTVRDMKWSMQEYRGLSRALDDTADCLFRDMGYLGDFRQ
jgi:hypothetical protein